MLNEGGVMVGATVARPGLLRALRFVAPLAIVLVFIQAIFAGRGMFLGGDAFAIHGGIGNLAFVLVVVQTALVYLAGINGRERALLLGMNVLLTLLLFAQLGLGYTGRSSVEAAALHVPTGVLIFGLMAVNLAMVFRLRR